MYHFAGGCRTRSAPHRSAPHRSAHHRARTAPSCARAPVGFAAHRVELLEPRRLLTAAPLRPDLIASSDSGVSDTDDVTRFDNATPAAALQFLVAGTTPGASVTLWLGGAAVATATAAGPGTLLTLDPAVRLANGTHAVTARQTDPDGEPSPASPALSFTVDTMPPPFAPGPPDLQTASDTGASNFDNVTSDNRPTITVTGGPYYRLLRNGVRVSGAYDSAAAYTSPLLFDGVHTFTLQWVDAAGNVSVASGPLQVTVDTAPPAAALAEPLAPPVLFRETYTFTVAYTDAFGPDAASIDNADLTITGGAFGSAGVGATRVGFVSQPDATRRVAIYQFAAPGGTWDGADNGTYTISLRLSQVRDLAGNFALPALLGNLGVNLPQYLAAPTLSPQTDSGVSDSDGVTNFDNGTPATAPGFVVRNTLRGATITVFVDGTAVGSATADGDVTTVKADGSLRLPDGHYSVTAEQTLDGAQPVPPSQPMRLTIDTIAPPRPAGIDLRAASDSGISDDDNLTNDKTPTLDVPRTLAPYFRVLRDGTLASDRFAAGPSFTAPPWPDGVHRLTAVAVDAAGNASDETAPLDVAIDTVAPPGGGVVGSLDASFEGDGRWMPAGVGLWKSVAVQPDGKVVVAGEEFVGGAAGTRVLVARLNADGSPDATFGTNGRTSTAYAAYGSVAVLPDGRIAVSFSNSVWCLTASGTTDRTFGNGGSTFTSFDINNIAAAPDGKILVAGEDSASDQLVVARLNPDGSFDTTFGGTGTVLADGVPAAVTVVDLAGTADGKVVLAGTSYPPGRTATSAVVVRFNADGSRDATFGTGGVAFLPVAGLSQAAQLGVDPDGSVTVSGGTNAPGTDQLNTAFLARLRGDGTPDTAFDGDGVVTSPGGGRGGRLSSGRFFIAKWEPDALRVVLFDGAGRPDASVPGGVTTSDPGTGGNPAGLTDFAVAPDGRLVLVGYHLFSGYRPAAFRLHGHTSGVPDLQAASDTGASAADNLTNDTTPTFDVGASEAQRQGYLRLYRDGALVGGDYNPVDAFTAPPQPEGTWNYTTSFVDAAGNAAPPSPALAVTIDTTAPQVAEAFAGNWSWSDAFTGALAAAGLGRGMGFALPTAEPAAGPATLPWANLNHFVFRTSEPIVVREQDARVDGDATGAYAVADFVRATTGTYATWTLGRVLAAEEVVVSLGEGITDTAGNRLGGAPGEGGAGTPFKLRFRVAPGDADRSGGVSALDLVSTRARLFTAPLAGRAGPRAYSVFNDFNGDGRINAADYHLARTRLSARPRPVAPPPAPDDFAPAVPQSATAAARAGTVSRRASLLHETSDPPLLPG